jgi:ubiquinone/menaquinone biosynthesis C-methylase UbiE
MKFLKAENPIEWIALKANLVPVPLIYGIAFGELNKVFLTALKLDIFEATKDSPQTAEQIAQKTGLHPKAITSLMNILAINDCFKYKDGKYDLTGVAKKWCLKNSPESMHGSAGYYEIVRDIWMNHLEEYLKTGKGIGVHDSTTEEEWHNYQIGMEDLAKLSAKSAPKITPMPGNPTEMLDIGGSHGLYCVELCKKYPTLKATILDLPEAVEKAQPILAKYNMGDRIRYWAGNALTDDFGENKYDLVLMSSLMHHFSAEENIGVSRKVARALKPGGYFVIQEFVRPETPSSKNGLGVLVDMLFNIMSTSNTWTKDELKKFQQEAGLIHHRVNNYMVPQGFVQVCAKKE